MDFEEKTCRTWEMMIESANPTKTTLRNVKNMKRSYVVSSTILQREAKGFRSEY